MSLNCCLLSAFAHLCSLVCQASTQSVCCAPVFTSGLPAGQLLLGRCCFPSPCGWFSQSPTTTEAPPSQKPRRTSRLESTFGTSHVPSSPFEYSAPNSAPAGSFPKLRAVLFGNRTVPVRPFLVCPPTT